MDIDTMRLVYSSQISYVGAYHRQWEELIGKIDRVYVLDSYYSYYHSHRFLQARRDVV
jgi:hypothetical protein